VDSELQVMKPKECQWWDMYVNNYLMLEDSAMRAKFWNMFRIPPSNYLEFMQWIQDDTRFACWCGAKVNNKMSSPIELLVLGSLRYLGRGWTFDNIEEIFPCFHRLLQYYSLLSVCTHSCAFA